MENHSFSSYPDSGNSSPRSREVDCDNNSSSWDDQLQQQQQPPPPPLLPQGGTYRVRFMCSYGGKIHPRPHDNQLAYVGGDTKILGVDRGIKFSALMAKLSALSDSPEVCLKYQLPGEDLDALISVTNDEDLDHMMAEYDRLHKAAAKPARLRLFLFPLTPRNSSSFGSGETKSEGQRQQWFVDALNSVQLQGLEGSLPPQAAAPPPPPPAANPDFLFGLENGLTALQTAPAAPEAGTKDASAGSECGSEDRHAIGDPMLSQAEIQRQIQELQRMQIANPALQRRADEASPKVLPGDSYGQQAAEKAAPASQGQVPVQVPVQIPAGYMQERHLTGGSYAVSGDQTVYYIPAPAGSYLAPASYHPVTGQVGQAFYGVQRVVPDVYREQAVYGTMQQQASIQQPPKGGQYTTEGIQVMQSKLAMPETGFTQVAYDSSGRQVFYTTAAGGMVPAYQAAAAAMAANQEAGKVAAAAAPAAAKAPPQPSPA